MASMGGPIESVSVRGRTFSVAGDADVSRKLGGFDNETEMNGDGTGRPIKTRMPWSLTGVTISIDDERGDQEYLQGLADLPDFYPVVITYVSGDVYSGDGHIEGDFSHASARGVAEIGFSGPGKLSRQ